LKEQEQVGRSMRQGNLIHRNLGRNLTDIRPRINAHVLIFTL